MPGPAMPPYDSESSDEGDDYTETNVLLGYAAHDRTADAVSHLGGSPAWLDEQTPPAGALARCAACNGLLSLLLELNGDLPEHFPGHDRRLYIWACRRKACARKEGSLRAIRGVRIASASADTKGVRPEEKPMPRLGESLFGVHKAATAAAPVNPFASPSASTSNPFSSPAPSQSQASSTPEPAAALAETFASKVALSAPTAPEQPARRPQEPWPAESSFPPPYPHYHLDAEYETLDVPAAPQVPENARIDMDPDGGRGKEDKDVYESSLDKTFQKFADRIGQNAEQVLRYEFKGKPLLYSDSDAVGRLLAHHADNGGASNAKVATASSKGGAALPPCRNCGAERVFELQLTPHAITELEADDMSIDGMAWGTIIMAVCSKDCKPSDVSDGEVGYVQEWLGVQWEEVASNKYQGR